MKEKDILYGGLNPLPDDNRDFDVGAAYTLPTDFPKKSDPLDIPQDWVRHQGQTDLCAGYASALASSTQEGVLLDPLFSWVMARTIRGVDPDHWGIDLRNMAKAHTKVGALEQKEAPYTVNDPQEKWRDVANWDVDDLLKKSVYHKKKSFLFVRPTQGMDMFDTLKAARHKFKTPIFIGIRWAYGEKPYIDEYQDGGFGHAVAIVGYDEKYLHAVNSWGKQAGDNGTFYLSRDVISHDVKYYGGVLFIDEDPETLKYHIENGIKLDESTIKNTLVAMYRGILRTLKQLLGIKQKQLREVVENQPKKPENPTLKELALAIKQYEGWFEGSRSYRNNNPGNLRASKFSYRLDDDGYCVFHDYNTGWKALMFQLQIARNGKSSVYTPDDTLLTFCEKWAPTFDNNDPNGYASFLAKKLGVTTGFKLKDLEDAV